ncbi:cytochrome c [Methylomonas sp. LL1]|uniref:cytochrome c n=1 Tax=Methylomonas sp. LL1 TaxID=2785785 RepID=UPI0018C3D5BF|nr:cytochrome c [Methylomonas sp. LL1]QPK64578.1 cytochrome c [Methylomonas sp. LL1]
MKKLIALMLTCGLLSACSSGPQQDEHSAAASDPALHAVQDRELRDLMDRMNSLMMERFMTEHEMDIERRKYARQIIETSQILATTAQSLVNKLPGLGLSPDEQSAFENLARKLGQHAHNLQTQAENRAFNSISSTLHEMKSTCMACHTLFRKL